VTRRAVPAAFLLFAAALLVVSPAEASRTTTDARSSLASSSSRELASLELPSLDALEPIESVDASLHFGFGEDLGLLDPEAGPGAFVLFAVEAAQCELTYARNNPLKYVDPDGRWAETALDVGLAAISVKQAIKSPTFWNIAGAVLDVGAVLIPLVPAVGGRVIDAVQAGDKLVDAASDAGKVVKEIPVSKSRFGEAAQHIEDAQRAGKPDVVTIKRAGAKSRRGDALEGTSPVPKKDRDEWPGAMFEEGGSGASVRPIDPSSNRACGAYIGRSCAGIPDGSKVRVVPVDK